NTHFVLVGDSLPLPPLFVQELEESEGGFTDFLELLSQVLQLAVRERTEADVIVLLIALDGRPIVAADSQGAVAKDSFGVVDVADDFLDRPFPRSISGLRLLLGNIAQEAERLFRFRTKGLQDIIARYK